DPAFPAANSGASAVQPATTTRKTPPPAASSVAAGGAAGVTAAAATAGSPAILPAAAARKTPPLAIAAGPAANAGAPENVKDQSEAIGNSCTLLAKEEVNSTSVDLSPTTEKVVGGVVTAFTCWCATPSPRMKQMLEMWPYSPHVEQLPSNRLGVAQCIAACPCFPHHTLHPPAYSVEAASPADGTPRFTRSRNFPQSQTTVS
ncbi:unnamed protein product, partial [Ectocarpus sp. 12 AP-2014]